MNELKVSLENIIPLTFARDHFSQIVSEVQKDKLFVLTKGGKPAVAIIDVKYLESITGGQIQKADIKEEIKRAPEKVGLPPMVEHPSSMPFKPMTPPPPPAPAKPITPPPVPKPIAPAPPPPKPAGFAAPSFASSDAEAMEDKKATEGKPQPQPAPAKPAGQSPLGGAPKPNPMPPPAPIPKPEPKPTPPPPPPVPPQPRADQPRVEKPAPAKGPGLVMPEEKSHVSSGIPNKPLTTLPPVQDNKNDNQVSVEFAPDEETMTEKSLDGKIPDGQKTAPDDKNPPAQYAGEEPASPAGGGKEPEPEDMALD